MMSKIERIKRVIFNKENENYLFIKQKEIYTSHRCYKIIII